MNLLSTAGSYEELFEHHPADIVIEAAFESRAAAAETAGAVECLLAPLELQPAALSSQKRHSLAPA